MNVGMVSGTYLNPIISPPQGIYLSLFEKHIKRESDG